MGMKQGLRRVAGALGIAIGVAAAAAGAFAQERSIVVASTTSTEQSGLFAHLLPLFTRASGIRVKVVAVGTGQALDMGRRGDADVVFVHDQAGEQKFVDEGFGLRRLPVMFNDFVIVGPRDDPLGIKGRDVAAALARVAASRATFISRGDKSGTHAAELRYWKDAGIVPAGTPGYKECGCGMGQALNIASSSDAHALTDRGTWLSFRNRGRLAVLVEGDKRLFNQYGVIVVDPARHPHVRKDLAQSFADWLVSDEGQRAIAGYRVGGEQLFFPNAGEK
jgi:tungstate transport system substrate-binding protein